MPRPYAPLALRVLLLSCAVLAVGAQTALATTVSYSDDGSTLIVDGADNLNHELQFHLSADATRDEIIDTVAFTSIPADCTVDVFDPRRISCPGHNAVQVDLGAGNDRVLFTGASPGCFVTYALNLGDGANTLNLSDACPPTPASTATVTSGSGHDDLVGGAQSAITFFAGDGDDDVTGGSGADIVHGGEGADRLLGGAGNDRVLGEGGADDLRGGAGDDTLLARDGELDAVDCGGESDSAVVDFEDVVVSCAAVDRTPGPPAPVVAPLPAPAPVVAPAPAPVVAPAPAPFGVTFSATAVGSLKIAKSLRFAVRCSAACRYKVTVVISARTAKRYKIGTRATTIATARGTLTAAGKKTAVLTLSARTLRLLQRARTVPASLRLRVTNAAGAVSVKSRRITLRR